jgi:hypothetical protein
MENWGNFQRCKFTNAADFKSLKMTPKKTYHTLADAIGLGKTKRDEMTKYDVLAVFTQTNALLSSDELRIRLRWRLDRRSVYSYLLRLARQGLLERVQPGRGRLAYRITGRGRERLAYLHRRAVSGKSPP